jgi:Secretion system C-terminal sorting domain/GEVED domain/Cleaved Adhesin Domain
MKKITLLFVTFIYCYSSHAQFNQNFDASTALPLGWSVINGGGPNGFASIASPTNVPNSLPNSIGIIYDAVAHDDYLVTPQIVVTAGVTDRLTFYVNNVDPLNVESYEVRISTTTATAAAMTAVLLPVGVAPNAWTQVFLDLTPYVGQSIYVGFHAVSTDKFRLLFDDVVNDALPNCIAPTAGLSIVNSPTQATLSWTSAVPNFEVLVQLATLPAPLVGAPDGTGVNVIGSTTYVATLPTLSNYAYYVRSECSDSFEFSTWSGPYLFNNIFAPYCGPVAFANSMEPITSVTFAGIAKTYINTVVPVATAIHHKKFADIATVAQNGTYPIVLKGNTDDGPGTYTNKYIVFVDWNQNGVLNDAGEVYFDAAPLIITSSTGLDAVSVTGNINVPVTATLGNTVIRIKKMYSTLATIPAGFNNPCISSSSGLQYGEVHDYVVNVTAQVFATDTFSSINFKSFPNPVKDILNLSYDKNITGVSILNLLGQEVLSIKNDNQEVKIDMSGLTAGVYLVKVNADNEVKTIKVIKE